MLEALVIAGLIAAPLGSVVLFLPARRHAQVTGAWPAARRLALAVLGTAVLAALVAGILRLLGAAESNLVAGVAGVVAISLIWLPATRRWSPRAPVLGVQHLPLRGVPGVRAGLDVRQQPRAGGHRWRGAAVGL